MSDGVICYTCHTVVPQPCEDGYAWECVYKKRRIEAEREATRAEQAYKDSHY